MFIQTTFKIPAEEKEQFFEQIREIAFSLTQADEILQAAAEKEPKELSGGQVLYFTKHAITEFMHLKEAEAVLSLQAVMNFYQKWAKEYEKIVLLNSATEGFRNPKIAELISTIRALLTPFEQIVVKLKETEGFEEL